MSPLSKQLQCTKKLTFGVWSWVLYKCCLTSSFSACMMWQGDFVRDLLLDELAKVIYYVLFVRGLGKLGGIHLIRPSTIILFSNCFLHGWKQSWQVWTWLQIEILLTPVIIQCPDLKGLDALNRAAFDMAAKELRSRAPFALPALAPLTEGEDVKHLHNLQQLTSLLSGSSTNFTNTAVMQVCSYLWSLINLPLASAWQTSAYVIT